MQNRRTLEYLRKRTLLLYKLLDIHYNAVDGSLIYSLLRNARNLHIIKCRTIKWMTDIYFLNYSDDHPADLYFCAVLLAMDGRVHFPVCHVIETVELVSGNIRSMKFPYNC